MEKLTREQYTDDDITLGERATALHVIEELCKQLCTHIQQKMMGVHTIPIKQYVLGGKFLCETDLEGIRIRITFERAERNRNALQQFKQSINQGNNMWDVTVTVGAEQVLQRLRYHSRQFGIDVRNFIDTLEIYRRDHCNGVDSSGIYNEDIGLTGLKALLGVDK